MNITENQRQILSGAENLLHTSLTEISFPVQGMDSQVFFVQDTNGKKYAIKYGKSVMNDITAFELLEKNNVQVPIPKLFGHFNIDGSTVIVLDRSDFWRSSL